VLPIAVRALPPSLVDGDRPALRLLAQGRLRYLVNNTVPPTRAEAFYPGSVARVDALGYGPDPGRPTDQTDRCDGDPLVLADRPPTHGPAGTLVRDMSGGPHTTLRPGDEGTIRRYDTTLNVVDVNWDNGSRLSMWLDEGDRIRGIDQPAAGQQPPAGDTAPDPKEYRDDQARTQR